MLDDKEVELFNKTLSNKRYKCVEQTNDGFVIVFEGDLVIKIENTGYDNCFVDLAHRIPSYEYKSIQ